MSSLDATKVTGQFTPPVTPPNQGVIQGATSQTVQNTDQSELDSVTQAVANLSLTPPPLSLKNIPSRLLIHIITFLPLENVSSALRTFKNFSVLDKELILRGNNALVSDMLEKANYDLTKIPKAWFDALKNVARSIRELNLKGGELLGRHANSIFELLPHVERLNIGSCCNALMEALDRNNVPITSLQISESSDFLLWNWDPWIKLPLLHLDLGKCDVTWEFIVLLATQNKLQSLSFLRDHYDNALRCLPALAKMTSLQKLSIDGAQQLQDKHVELFRFSNLHTLKLQGGCYSLTDQSAEHLAQMPHLRNLDMDLRPRHPGQITPEFFRTLTKLPLTELAIRSKDRLVDRKMMKYIAMLPVEKLVINCFEKEIEPCLECLAKKKTPVKVLDITSCGITNSSMQFIAALPEIQTVIVKGTTSVTKACLPYFKDKSYVNIIGGMDTFTDNFSFSLETFSDALAKFRKAHPPKARKRKQNYLQNVPPAVPVRIGTYLEAEDLGRFLSVNKQLSSCDKAQFLLGNPQVFRIFEKAGNLSNSPLWREALQNQKVQNSITSFTASDLFLLSLSQLPFVFERFKNFKLIDLSNIHDYNALPLLPIISKMPNLTDLRLSGSKVTDKTLLQLQEATNLRSFRLQDVPELTDNAAKSLAMLSSLERLEMPLFAKVTAQFFETLAQAKLPLKKLILRNNYGAHRLPAVALESIAKLPLEELTIPPETFDGVDDSLRYFSAFRTPLKVVDLSSCDITRKGMRFLAVLPTIEKVILDNCYKVPLSCCEDFTTNVSLFFSRYQVEDNRPQKGTRVLLPASSSSSQVKDKATLDHPVPSSSLLSQAHNVARNIASFLWS